MPLVKILLWNELCRQFNNQENDRPTISDQGMIEILSALVLIYMEEK